MAKTIIFPCEVRIGEKYRPALDAGSQDLWRVKNGKN